MTSYDVANNMCQCVAGSHTIDTLFHPPAVIELKASCDMASIICKALLRDDEENDAFKQEDAGSEDGGGGGDDDDNDGAEGGACELSEATLEKLERGEEVTVEDLSPEERR